MLLFSIIIPTFNRRERLLHCIQAISGLEFPVDKFEVIIVNDGGEIHKDEIFSFASNRLSISFIDQDHLGPATSRNRGASHAKGKYLVFTDDDCKPESKWLSWLEERFVLIGESVICGCVINGLPGNIYSTASQLLTSFLSQYHNHDPEKARFFTSNNFAIPADLFQKIGGFDELFREAGGEDRELCDRLEYEGVKIVYDPEVKIYHEHILTFGSFLHQHYRYGFSALQFRKSRVGRVNRDVKIESHDFYSGMLKYPFKGNKPLRAMVLMFLMGLSQVVNFYGFLCAKLKEFDFKTFLRLKVRDLRRFEKLLLSSIPCVVKPRQLQIIITDRCNYRCPTCSKWHETSSDGELTTTEWREFLRKAHSLTATKTVVFGGGEPLLRQDISELIGYAKYLQLKTVLSTNGSLLRKDKLVEMQDAGLDYLMVSLNAVDSEIHDDSRGVKGSYLDIMKALDSYGEIKGEMKLGIGAVIMERNLKYISGLVDLVEERNLHGLILQSYVDDLVHHPLRLRDGFFRNEDWYSTDPYVVKSLDLLDIVIDDLLLSQRNGARILNAPSQLKAMRNFYREPCAYNSIRCVAGVNSFHVDPYGNVRSCFMMESIGNIKDERPVEIWNSNAAAAVRKRIQDCQRSCRMMNRNY